MLCLGRHFVGGSIDRFGDSGRAQKFPPTVDNMVHLCPTSSARLIKSSGKKPGEILSLRAF